MWGIESQLGLIQQQQAMAAAPLSYTNGSLIGYTNNTVGSGITTATISDYCIPDFGSVDEKLGLREKLQKETDEWLKGVLEI